MPFRGNFELDDDSGRLLFSDDDNGRALVGRESGKLKFIFERLIFRTRNRTDPISGFANNGDAPGSS